MDSGQTENGNENGVSCERCQKRKSRCDRTHPSCQRCQKSGSDCRYPGRKRPGFPSGHRLALEMKIKTLEDELQALRQPQPPTCSEVYQEGNASFVGASDAVSVQDDPNNSTDHAPSDLTLDGSNHSTALSRSQESYLTATFERTSRITERKPPSDLVLSLTSLFFRHIHPWFPVLDAQSIFAPLWVMDEPSLIYYALFGISLPYSSDARLDAHSSDSYWKYSKRCIMLGVLEEPCYKSLEALMVLSLDLSGMTNGPQVWGTLAVAIRFASQLKPQFGGRALRTWNSTTEQQRTEMNDVVDYSYRSRLFWAIYAIDCFVSITTSHPSELSDLHFQEFLPSRQITWQEQPRAPLESRYLNCPASIVQAVFLEQLRLMDVSRRIHNIFIAYTKMPHLGDTNRILEWRVAFCRAAGDLLSWAQALPESLCVGVNVQETSKGGDQFSWLSSQSPAVTMLHSFYHALTLHLHGLISNSPPLHRAFVDAHCPDLAEESRNRCTSSVAALVEIASKAMATDKLAAKIGWPFSWALWVAARYLLVDEYHHKENITSILARKDFETLFQALKTMSKHWQISAKYLRMLWLVLAQVGKASEDTRPIRFDQVFGSVLDLSVSTSDLEDMFRTDPMMEISTSDGQFAWQQWTPSTMTNLPFYPDLGPIWDNNAAFFDLTDEVVSNCSYGELSYLSMVSNRHAQNGFIAQ